jgi:Bacterioferritin (cytochrome b1)
LSNSNAQKGDNAMHEKSIELLNKAVADEMYAAHQYMFFHFHCEKQGHELLSNLFSKTAVQEMRHVQRCAKQILILGGEVELTASNSVQKIHDVKAMLEMACKMEQGSISDYNQWAIECDANSDSASRNVFKGLIVDEKLHYSQYDLERENAN